MRSPTQQRPQQQQQPAAEILSGGSGNTIIHGGSAAPGAAGSSDRRAPPRGWPSGGLQLAPPQQPSQPPGADAFGVDAMLCSPTASIGGVARFLGSPLPPLFHPSPRRAPESPSARRGLASPLSGLSNMFASPLRMAHGGGRMGGAGDVSALQFAADLLATPCSKRGSMGGDLTAADVDALMSSPPPPRCAAGGGPGSSSAYDPAASGRRAGSRRAPSLDLLDLVGAPPAAAAAAAAAVAAAQGPLSPTATTLSAGELDLLALLQGPAGTEVGCASASGPSTLLRARRMLHCVGLLLTLLTPPLDPLPSKSSTTPHHMRHHQTTHRLPPPPP